MAADDVLPAEMPDHPAHPTVPLDDDTAERLLAGRLHPEDAPPGYAEVTRLLRAAAGPPTPEELAGEGDALAMFRAARRPGPVAGRRRPALVRSRLVALTLAGALVAGALWIGGGVMTAGEVLAAGGMWIADGARTALGLGSPSGGPGSLRPATGPPAGGQAPSSLPAGRDGRGGGPAHGTGPGSHGKPPEAKPSKRKPPKDDAGPDKPKSKGPKAKPAKGKAAKA
jgi:hypothetical protein